MKKTFGFLLVIVLLSFAFTAACRKAEQNAESESVAEAQPSVEGGAAVTGPDRLSVQHILISFRGSINKENVIRTQDEAEKLALEIFERAKGGEDFDALVKQYTDDQHPGIYRMTNVGIEADRAQGEYPRGGMVKAFGDVSFSLEVNGIGLAVYDPQESKYGWHIIKRLE